MFNRRFAIIAGALLILIWTFKLFPVRSFPFGAWNKAKETFHQTVGSGGSSGSGSSSGSASGSASGSTGGSTGGSSSGSNSGSIGGSSSSSHGTPKDPGEIGWTLPAGFKEAPSATYFEQVFSAGHPHDYEFRYLKEACEAADWDHNEAYLNCQGIEAGMTSIVSQVKVCLKMAVETGSHLLLPTMPLRDSKDLLEFNFLNQDAYMPYDKWFDDAHLREQLARACPRMKILHPSDLETNVHVEHRFPIMCSDAHGYTKLHSYFWVGRPFRPFFEREFRKHMDEIASQATAAAIATAPPVAPIAAPVAVPAPAPPAAAVELPAVPPAPVDPEAAAPDPAAAEPPLSLPTPGSGSLQDRSPEDAAKPAHKTDSLLPAITVVDTDSEFMVFRITDDPTRRELRLWNDLSHLVRFRQDVRTIVDRIMTTLEPRGHYYGVHFRVENDSLWSSLEHQLGVDLDALDRAWAKFGGGGSGGDSTNKKKPLVYLACGDSRQVERFVTAGAERGWEVTHKWRLADEETTAQINAMAFDFQGAIDMGVMMRSDFFIGVQGSAFSSTVSNQRDVTGRYRGSSFDIPDEGARTHLFNDMDANEYACCL